jgi:DNA-binding response OmpR family regulator
MSANTNIRLVVFSAPAAAEQPEERFAERRRIALLEPDAALRRVLIPLLLRLGCVVSVKRELAQVIEALQTGPLDAAIVALEPDNVQLEALRAANRQQVPIVLLMDVPVGPLTASQFPDIHFLEKPFDARELLAGLNLPEKPTILTER